MIIKDIGHILRILPQNRLEDTHAIRAIFESGSERAIRKISQWLGEGGELTQIKCWVVAKYNSIAIIRARSTFSIRFGSCSGGVWVD